METIRDRTEWKRKKINISDHRFMEGFEGRELLPDPIEDGTPSVQLSENDLEYKLEIGLPGYCDSGGKSLDIDVKEDQLLIQSERPERDRTIEKMVTIPAHVENDEIAAFCEDGRLEVILPKQPHLKTNKEMDIRISI